jgi:hypothetical protein
LAHSNIENGHHEDLEALVLEAAPIQARHRIPEEIDYLAHVLLRLLFATLGRVTTPLAALQLPLASRALIGRARFSDSSCTQDGPTQTALD